MIVSQLPLDEILRLQNLESYDILDTDFEDDFDELVELAGKICNCPISTITLLDKDRQWFKARTGIEDRSTPREQSFCSHAITEPGVMSITDASKDERFSTNPLVTGDPNIRFYAGAPIISAEGFSLGAICIIDHKPKQLNAEQERILVILANQVSKLLELRKKNKIIRERAEEILEIKTASINRFIKGQEAIKKDIATDLHEDLAQKLAASVLTLKMAEQQGTERVPLISTAARQVQEVISNIRSLSYAITPHSIDWIPAEELISEFIHKTAITYPFPIEVDIIGERSAVNAELSLSAIRIIESWLKLLSIEKQVKQVAITVITGNKFEFSIADDNDAADLELRREEIFSSLLYERVQQHQGHVELSMLKNGINVLKIVFPAA